MAQSVRSGAFPSGEKIVGQNQEAVMKFGPMHKNFLRKLTFISITMAVSAFAWGQSKPKASAPKPAAAPKAAPSHPSAPSGQHSSAPGGQHSNTMPSQHGATAGGQHGMTPGGQHGTTAGGQHGMAPGGQHGTTPGGQHGATAGGQHGMAPGGQHGGTPAGQHGGAGGMNASRGGHTPPGRQVSLRGGRSAHIRPNGRIRSVNRNGMHIEHGVRGDRRVVSTRNGVRVVSVGHRGGYVQRAYVVRGGHSYYSRTYYYHGGYRSGVYRGYYYGGHPYYGYYPPYYYHPAYYGWAYNPWPAPVAYGWGWGGAPWYGYYGAYYQPYPVYPSAAFWLTDFVIAASLQAAYEAQNAQGFLHYDAGDGTLVASLYPMAADAAETAKLSPEVKKALADEVKALLGAEQADAGKAGSSAASSSGSQPANKDEAPPALDPNFRTFMVSDDLSLVVDGDECALSNGDVVQRTSDAPDDDQNVNVKVVASTKSDCAIGKEGPLAVDDLQEMYNHLREQLNSGMGELAKKQGTGGLPKAPDTTMVTGDVPPPPPDKTAEKTLSDQAADADKTETEVKQEAGSGGGGGR